MSLDYFKIIFRLQAAVLHQKLNPHIPLALGSFFYIDIHHLLKS